MTRARRWIILLALLILALLLIAPSQGQGRGVAMMEVGWDPGLDEGGEGG